MPSKMYENIDNELLDRLRPLELKDIDLNLIQLRKIESNPCNFAVIYITAKYYLIYIYIYKYDKKYKF